MRLKAILAVAISLFAICSLGSANRAEAADTTAQQAKKTTKKPARKKAPANTVTKEDAAAIAASMVLYKKELAQRIAETNPTQVYATQPQAMLRSVVVLRFIIDANGKILYSAIQRSNLDTETEDTALASLRNAQPLPKPPAKLLTKGRLELSETWLFNDDGRFQIRSIALNQKTE